jgi:hypothetical protein
VAQKFSKETYLYWYELMQLIRQFESKSEEMYKMAGKIRGFFHVYNGQEAIAAQPAVMAPQIEKSFGGYGMPREVGQYEVSPAVAGKEAVPGQAAIPARPAVPAGYISPEMLKGIDIPEVKQLAMAKYLAQFEPKQVTLSDNQRLLERIGSNDFKEVVGAAKTPATTTLSPLGKLQSERAAIFATDPKDARLPAYDKAILKESEDQNLAFNREKFEWEKGNQGLKLEKITNDLGEEVLMAVNSAGIGRPVMTGTGEIVKSAPPVKMIRVETEAADGSIKMVLMSEKDQKLNIEFVKTCIENAKNNISNLFYFPGVTIAQT